MKKLLKYVGTLNIIALCLSLPLGTVFALEQSQPGSSSYGYYNNGYGYYGGYLGNYNYYGCGAVDPSRYPGSTEYCTKWIPGHWVSVRMMVPGRWVYRPVWIPGYPTSIRQWVPGFWQTTAYHTRPDVYVWGSPNRGWYGIPYQNYHNTTGGGYFDQYGVWHPNRQ